MMMHLVGEVILDKQERVGRENNSLGCVDFGMPLSYGRCPVKYCFHWLNTKKWENRSFTIIDIWVVVCGVFELQTEGV